MLFDRDILRSNNKIRVIEIDFLFVYYWAFICSYSLLKKVDPIKSSNNHWYVPMLL